MGRRSRTQARPTRAEFARIYADRLRLLGETAQLEYDAASFSLIRPGPRPKITNLGNIYEEYLKALRSDRDGVLRHYVQLLMDPEAKVPTEYADARPNILPRVRNRSFGSILELQFRVRGASARPEPVFPFAEHLAIEIIHDLPDVAYGVNPGNLSKWGVTFERALQDALGNLQEMSREGLRLHSPGVWRSPWSDDHDAARILLTEMVEQLPVQGDPVVGIPNRNTLIVTGSEDTDGLRRLALLSSREFAKRDAITAIPFRVSARTWSPFLPPEGHPHHPAFRMLWLNSLQADYETQSELLRQLKGVTGDQAWVSSFLIGQGSQTGQVSSLCMWPVGTEVLVPETDIIWFVRTNLDERSKPEVVAQVTWDQARQYLGDRMEPTGLFPPCFRVLDGLSEGEVIAMQA